MRTLRVVVLVSIFGLSVLLAELGAAAPGSRAVLQQRVLLPLPANLLLRDQPLIAADRLHAVALDRRVLLDLLVPPRLDYSPQVTFIRCQDGGGGCPGMTHLHIEDMLREWEHPFTPDLSFMGIDQINADQIVAAGLAGATSLPDLGTGTITTHGLPSEALYHSNYDRMTPRLMQQTTSLWKKGDQVGWQEGLSARAQAECALYKMTISASQTLDPRVQGHVTAHDLKLLLLKYGPIYASGWWRDINPTGVEGHVMTLVGYDDAAGVFTYLNSWGSWFTHNHNTPSYGTIRYQDIFWQGGQQPEIPAGQTYDDIFYKYSNISSVRYLTTIPSARWQSPDAYTARIRIRNSWRASLNVRVGVEGGEMLTVYDTRGRVPGRRGEWNNDFNLDVPLPEYAASNWPPTGNRRWVLEVEDCDRDGRTGTITEFTLARLREKPNCYSLGRFATDTYGGACNTLVPDPTSGAQVPATNTLPQTPNPNPGSARVFVPAAAATTIVGPALHANLKQLTSYKVRLPKKLCSVTAGGELELIADLRLYSVAEHKWLPVKGKKLSFYELKRGTNVNKPSEWTLVKSAETRDNGRAVIRIPSQLGVHVYAAAFRGDDGQIAASSHPLTYDNTVKLRPVIEYAQPGRELIFPDLNLPRPPLEELEEVTAPLVH